MPRFSQTGFTVGVGLTDRCNANCPHCYSRPECTYHDIDFDLLYRLLETVPIKSVNFGTGESILYDRFVELSQLLKKAEIPVSVTTNGSTVAALTDDELRLFHDVDFSLDFPDPELNDRWRGAGSFDFIMAGAERCCKLGVEASLVSCLMKENSTYMGKLAALAMDLDLNLRINVYKSVFTREHQPNYAEFWGAIADLANTAYFIACSEPVVCAAIGYDRGVRGNPCGNRSFRVHPDGKIVACVYLRNGGVSIVDFVADPESTEKCLHHCVNLHIPAICQECKHVELCTGGCASRRLLNTPTLPDEYCFLNRSDAPQITARWKQSKDLVHENYLCTMIFSG